MSEAPGFSLGISRISAELDALLTAIAAACLGFLFAAACLRTTAVGLFCVAPGSFEDYLMRCTWAGFSILGAIRGYRLRRGRDLVGSLAQVIIDLFKAALVYVVTYFLVVTLDSFLGIPGLVMGLALGLLHGYLLVGSRRDDLPSWNN